ncbi:thioredoxin [Sulfuritortus calidifontis]|uniref:Thioredoxin n=1 Tax=Sulfuritortus calidifontis TaxID=1914471 RepID=A0A4R3JW94_9PROT|nr:co-chaperone YbbN [Sulfuritortus calidifontis]TCS72441.1 thioredoxin [Sulfuritortus calidifontis]
MGQFAFDVDSGNFQQIVIEGSKKVPVVVDFWAPWCGPCKVLKPILEKLAEEYAGKFILAKVNSDENQELAAQFGVRGIPSVKAIYGGEIVDEFSGAIPEGQVRAFLDRIIPSPAEELRLKAAELKAAGEAAQALQLLAEASKLDAGNEKVRLDAAEILCEAGELDEARRLLDSLSPAMKQEDRVARLAAKINFALSSQGGGDEAALRDKIKADAKDMDSRLQLAKLLIASGRHAEGMDQLLEMIRIDRAWNDEAARKTMLDVFNLLAGSPLVAEYRRKLASALN